MFLPTCSGCKLEKNEKLYRETRVEQTKNRGNKKIPLRPPQVEKVKKVLGKTQTTEIRGKMFLQIRLAAAASRKLEKS